MKWHGFPTRVSDAGHGLETRATSTPLITRVGLVTALGATAQQTWQALLAGRHLHDHSPISIPVPPGGSRVLELAQSAIHDAAIADRIDRATALVVGTSKGPVEKWLTAPPQHILKCTYELAGGLRGTVVPPVSWAGEHGRDARATDPAHGWGLSEIASQIAGDLGLTGPRLTVCAACASGLQALVRGAMLIRSGEAQRVLVVAAEASIHPLFVASFGRLGVLPKSGEGCRPFDQERAGFLMSDAAAAVLLEAEEIVEPGTGPIHPIAVDRFALGSDAMHITAGDPDGKVLRELLKRTLSGGAVDLIHGHGTGTVFNDEIELKALEHALPVADPLPILYSHKGALGHSLGASGLLSVVLNVFCHSHGVVPPNIKTQKPLPAARLFLPQATQRRRIQSSIVIAAGFGGPTAVVRLVSTSREDVSSER